MQFGKMLLVGAAAFAMVLGTGCATDDEDLEMFRKHLEERFWFVKVKDTTGIELRAEDYVGDISLKGEFIRKVMAEELPEELKTRVIECGLAALSGQEVL